MNLVARILLAALCHLPGGLCLAQSAGLSCPEIQYEASIGAEPPRLAIDRLAGQAVFSAPEIPRMLGSIGNICMTLFAERPAKAVASASTNKGGAFAFENVKPGNYVLIGRHASGVGGTIRLPIHISGTHRQKDPTRGLLLRVDRHGGKQSGHGETIANLELRQMLVERLKTDQAVRMEMIDKGSANIAPELRERMNRIDAETDAMLSAIMREHGWPGLDVVGLDGTEAASTMLQHVSAETRRLALPLVEASFRAGNVLGPNYASHVDKARLSEGRPQLYGTAAKPFGPDGQVVFEPIDDEAHVDARRAEMGLMPLEEYRKFLREVYFPKKAPKASSGSAAAAASDNP